MYYSCKMYILQMAIVLASVATVKTEWQSADFSLDTKSALSVALNKDSSFVISVAGDIWLRSAPPFFHIGGRTYSAEDGSLQLVATASIGGQDSLGSWAGVQFIFSAGDVNVSTAVKRYYRGAPAIVFEQKYPGGALNTSVGNPDKLISGFPGFGFASPADPTLGYMAYGGSFVGSISLKTGRVTKDNFTVTEGRNSGPIAFFDRGGRHALFLTPMDCFMSAASMVNRRSHGYYWGIMGSVKEIPKSFSMRTILYYGAGIRDAVENWGQSLRQYYKKTTEYRGADITNRFLSYWSDNGAYYVNYYEPDGLIQNMTYEKAMQAVKQYAVREGIPYRSVQYSVWFKQGPLGGNLLWEANPKLFPHKMRYMFQETGLVSTAHSRFWSRKTPYAKQNGGKYDFFVENLYSLPFEQRFWSDMFAASKQWGMVTYMQDWMNEQFDMMNATTDNVHVARTWLRQMGEGARLNDVTIMYCMAESRHVLQSLEIPAVTQVRASDDYHPGSELQWRVGMTSLLAQAVGLAVFKDVFWTTSDQPGNYYHSREQFPALQAVVSSLTAGPVGPGDMVRGTNRELLMRCCADDGWILKPSEPARATDSQILQAAFGGNHGADGQVWTTYSDVDQWRFGIIFAADMRNSVLIDYKMAGFGQKFPKSRIIKVHGDTRTAPAEFGPHHPVTVTSSCTKGNFCLYYTSPVFQLSGHEYLILGELSKWIPVSPERVLGIQVDSQDIALTLRGAPGENVTFTFSKDSLEFNVTCTLARSGSALIIMTQAKCHSQ